MKNCLLMWYRQSQRRRYFNSIQVTYMVEHAIDVPPIYYKCSSYSISDLLTPNLPLISIHYKNTFKLTMKKEELQNIESGKLQFSGDVIVMGRRMFAYGKQMLTHDMLYITDAAIEIQMSLQIDEFDQHYFLTLLNKHIVTELQICQPGIALQILKQMPSLDIQTYSFIFLKLSLTKLQKLLMDDQFYLYIFHTCFTLVNAKEPSLVEMGQIQRWMCDICMSQPYQRLLNLLDSLRKDEEVLRPAIEQTTHEIVLLIIRSNQFILNLAYDANQDPKQPKIKPTLLKELLAIMTTLQSLAKTPHEITDFYHLTHKDLMCQFIFTKECLNIISNNFEHFFLYERKMLMRVLSLIATHDNVSLWTQLISLQNKVQSTEQPQKEQEENTQEKESKRKIVKVCRYFDNIVFFSQMVLSNFYGGNQEGWDLSLHILQQLINTNLPQVHEPISRIVIEVLENKWGTQEIELALQLLQSMAAIKPNYSPLLPAILTVIVNRINLAVYDVFKSHSRVTDRFPDTKSQNTMVRPTSNLLRLPKINSSQLSTYLRVFIQIIDLGLIDLLQPGQFCLIVQKILFMSKGRDGILLGLRRIIQKKIGQYVQSRAQQQSQLKKGNDNYLLRNRKQLKNFKISTPKVDPNSLDRFKGLLLM